jgi:hypothetical protein
MATITRALTFACDLLSSANRILQITHIDANFLYFGFPQRQKCLACFRMILAANGDMIRMSSGMGPRGLATVRLRKSHELLHHPQQELDVLLILRLWLFVLHPVLNLL